MKRKLLLAGLATLLLAGIMIFNLFNQSYETKDLAIHSTEVVKSKIGLQEDGELSFNDIMEKSSYVLVGKISGTSKLNEARTVFNVDVEENVLGETNELVLVYADEELLEVGEKYLFFLEPFNSSLYDKDFFTQHPEFIIKIDEKGTIQRLVNAFESKYEKPFIKDQFNNLSNIKSFIKDNYSSKNRVMAKVMDDASKTTLIEQSDYIIEINVKSIDSVNGLSVIEYDTVKEHKGFLKNNPSIILPSNQVENGKDYLIFLNDKGNGTVTLSSRNGSIIEIGTVDYTEIIESLNQ